MHKGVVVLCLLAFSVLSAVAQHHRFYGVLVNALDSTVVPHAAISLEEAKSTVFSDDSGRFSFPGPITRKDVTLTISAIGIRATIPFHRVSSGPEKVFVELVPEGLQEFTVVGLSAEEVVREAVKRIPQNYADSSFFCPSFYRRYEKVNDRFANLVEGRPVVMFNINAEKRQLTYKPAFAVKLLRRTRLWRHPGHPELDNMVHLFSDDQVFNLEKSSLNPKRFSKYRFVFDTSAHLHDYYVIRYFINDFSLETHGVTNLTDDFWGESYEKGKIVIDRGSFAIVTLTRNTWRYRDYTYPKMGGNNWVLPERRYYTELRDGTLEANYKKVGGRWYPDRLLHNYTNEYYRGGGGKLEYVVTTYDEWKADTVSRYTSEDFVNRFYPVLQEWAVPYDTLNAPLFRFPFFFENGSDVYRTMYPAGNPLPPFVVDSVWRY